MTWGGEDDREPYEEEPQPRNGFRGLFFGCLFSLIIVGVIMIIKC